VPLLSPPLQILAHSSEDKGQNKRWFPATAFTNSSTL
jgi:hypothetical protein